MKLCHLVNSLDPASGGPAHVIVGLAAAQAALGHQVTLIGARARHRDQVTHAFLRRVLDLERVHLVLLDQPTGLLAGWWARTFVSALDRGHPFDIVHLHGVWDACLLRAAAWCDKRRTPYLVRPAGMLDHISLGQKALKKRLALGLTHGHMLRHAAAIHALNDHERRAVLDLGLAVRVEVIPNGLALEDIESETEPDEFRSSIRSLADNPFVLFLGRLHHKKGLDVLADAWIETVRDFPDHRLIVAGPREDDSIDGFRRRVHEAGIEDKVIEVGAVYGRKKIAAFRECTCFVLPSRQEGFSVAVIEALGLGAPVVITRECHFPEVEEVGAGVVTELEADALAQGLRRVIADQGFRESAREKAARLIRRRFIWPSIAAQTLDLYEQLVSN